MSLNVQGSTTSTLTAISAIALILLGACAAPPPPERPPAPSSELTFDAGVDYAIDDLLVQARRLPAFSAAPKTIASVLLSAQLRNQRRSVCLLSANWCSTIYPE